MEMCASPARTVKPYCSRSSLPYSSILQQHRGGGCTTSNVRFSPAVPAYDAVWDSVLPCLFQGLGECLAKELTALAPYTLKIKVVGRKSSTLERGSFLSRSRLRFFMGQRRVDIPFLSWWSPRICRGERADDRISPPQCLRFCMGQREVHGRVAPDGVHDFGHSCDYGSLTRFAITNFV